MCSPAGGPEASLRHGQGRWDCEVPFLLVISFSGMILWQDRWIEDSFEKYPLQKCTPFVCVKSM